MSSSQFKSLWMTLQAFSCVCVWCAGPDFWGLVNPEWYVCTKGKRQSPINIDPQKLLFDANLRALRIDKHRVRHPQRMSVVCTGWFENEETKLLS